jgi:hypothetical protein
MNENKELDCHVAPDAPRNQTVSQLPVFLNKNNN